MKTLTFLSALLLAVVIGCSNTVTGPASQQNGSLKMYLVDSPSSLDSVIVSVEQVEVHKVTTDSTSGWYVINSTPRLFDLLQLRNGASAVLGDSVLGPGKYTQIRLILGQNNYIVDTNGVKHSLTVPSGLQTGIKLNHEFTIKPTNLYELVLDFNVDQSVHITGNRRYMMKPVIRVTPMVTSGTISGYVLPLDAQATVSAITGSDTVSAYPNATTGFFKLVALPEGTYNVEVNPGNSTYKDTVIADVNVIATQNTSIDTVSLSTN